MFKDRFIAPQLPEQGEFEQAPDYMDEDKWGSFLNGYIELHGLQAVGLVPPYTDTTELSPHC